MAQIYLVVDGFSKKNLTGRKKIIFASKDDKRLPVYALNSRAGQLRN